MPVLSCGWNSSCFPRTGFVPIMPCDSNDAQYGRWPAVTACRVNAASRGAAAIAVLRTGAKDLRVGSGLQGLGCSVCILSAFRFKSVSEVTHNFRVAVGPFRHETGRFGTRETFRYVESRAGAKIETKTPRAFRGRPARAGTPPRVLGRPATCWHAPPRAGTPRRVLARPAACWHAPPRAGTPRRVLARPPRAGTPRHVLARPPRAGTPRAVPATAPACWARPPACWDAPPRAGTPRHVLGRPGAS